MEALLSGRNCQTIRSRLGRVYAVDTEIWDAHGAHRHRLARPGPRGALLGLLPFETVLRRRSISFDRHPAVVSQDAP